MHRRTLLQGAAALCSATLAAPALAQPAKAATLRFVPQANLTLLDPVYTTAVVSGNHAYYVFDTLYSVDSHGVAKPQMAEGHDISDNGRLWRIRLREGLKFHDNTPVRAIDCVTSLQRWTHSRDSFGQIIGKVVEQWGVVDDRTIELRLTRPFPLLPAAIGKADEVLAVIMPERLARTDINTQVTEMVGSGPYRFIAGEFNPGSLVVYEKFDGYVPRKEPPDWATGAKIAYFPRVEWHIIPDPATAAAALQNGEIDWWEQPTADLLPLLKRNEKIAILTGQGQIALMRMNLLQPPFNDLAIRRAVLMAVNQEDYMRASYGDDHSMWRVCQSVFPCGTPYETDDSGRLMKADMNAARAALKATRYTGEKVVVINPTDYAPVRPLGQVTAAMLKDLGMNVDLQETDWGTVVQRRYNKGPVEKGGWSVFHTYGSASGLATPATSPFVRGLGEAGFFGWWNSPPAEQLVQEWLDAPDEATQQRAITALANLTLDEVATVPLGEFYLPMAYRRTLTGMLPGVAPYPWNVRPT